MSDRWEAEGALTILVSPLIGVLSMVIGCSILDDSGYEDYQPLYLAARIGALGGPIAAFFCLLVSSIFTMDDIGGIPEMDPEIVRCQVRMDQTRMAWGLITPYLIGLVGGPLGSAILQAAQLAKSIEPLSAVRAAAVGGIFATPIYYVFGYILACIFSPYLREPPLLVDEPVGIP
ncbi:uncharacterized protein MELLADRAFT_108410 [Melampsora larici-populina 98AG31]|uniref:Uncharacterized protein n=1 Tax=Melampsora larici-populina (strain 98AG31 / pathotype 3-4-7) TaxID=747676 RepID=F4RT07_MELLP|nr:uncharacterized protein MELLADRAFT_108410 [Melampsora larici-populina 98AG31]EGG04512.1 hypothetical protein MELLADRAFT_108410 [Melampsora larici-populina 98AG31]